MIPNEKEPIAARNPDAHPLADYPDYRSTILRHPSVSL